MRSSSASRPPSWASGESECKDLKKDLKKHLRKYLKTQVLKGKYLVSTCLGGMSQVSVWDKGNERHTQRRDLKRPLIGTNATPHKSRTSAVTAFSSRFTTSETAAWD